MKVCTNSKCEAHITNDKYNPENCIDFIDISNCTRKEKTFKTKRDPDMDQIENGVDDAKDDSSNVDGDSNESR